MPELIQELIYACARRAPAALALSDSGARLTYAALAQQVHVAAQGLQALGAAEHDKVVVWLDNSAEAAIAMLGAAAAGCVFVPVDAGYEPRPVQFILKDCRARVLVTSAERLARLSAGANGASPAVVATGATVEPPPGWQVTGWDAFMAHLPLHDQARRDGPETAALLYRLDAGALSAVTWSHREMLVAARSSARYLDYHAHDRLLAMLPFSADYGLGQLISAFSCGAALVMTTQSTPQGIVETVMRERITALAALLPQWTELAEADWSGATSLRHIAVAGGVLARPVLDTLRHKLPRTRIYFMYGLAEPYRASCLGPVQVGRHRPPAGPLDHPLEATA